VTAACAARSFKCKVFRVLRSLVVVYGRLALGIGFLSAVADRVGLWGPPGARNVAWGDFSHFLAYTAKVNPYLTSSLVPALGWFVTACEIGLGVLLIAGVQLRLVAILSGFLLLAFATGMTIGTGVKTALDASVFSASVAAFLLAAATGPAVGAPRAGPSVSADDQVRLPEQRSNR
jgi:thiosulfate dehydrogenase [quinone] large subunit